MCTVLASLLLSPGQVVSDFRLTEMLWGEDPPPTTQAQIHTYASRLRGLLGADIRVERQHPGYRLRVLPGRLNLDLAEFEQLAEQGHAALAAGQMRVAAGLLRAALALWNGQALAGVTDHLAAIEQPRLEEARLIALEDRIDADLALGEHERLIPELTALAAAQPLRERPRAQLMLGLYRSGRAADALAAYLAFRRLLVEEMGIDPSAELQHLHQSILADDPSLMPPMTVVPARPLAAAPVLPPEPSDFTGREAEIARASMLLTTSGLDGATSDMCAITGMCGVGKTALALRVTRQLRAHFSDGQIRVDLGGSRLEPRSPAWVLTQVLIALGVDSSALPESADDLATLYRNRLSGTRTLLLFDDAEGERQVRPLLPGVAGCAVLVTSRSRLTALEGSCRIELGVLSPDQSVELLAKIVDSERVSAAAPAARRIAELCGYLPLAIRICAARLAARPHAPFAEMAQRLHDQDRLLDELRLADLDVGNDLASSFWKLRLTARRALLMLHGIEPPAFSVAAAATHLELSPAAAYDLLEEITESYLLNVDAAGPGHYRFSHLVRAFAARQVKCEVSMEQLQKNDFTMIREAVGTGMR